jgi:hypothetical protein
MLASDTIDRRTSDSDVPAAALLLLVAVPLAVWLYVDFLPASRLLWRDINNDRNGHFQYGLSLALDLLNGNLVAFVADLNRATSWPPFHGIVLAAVLLVGGIDERFGVLPSLAGWVITVVAAALTARRLVARAADASANGPAIGAFASGAALIFVAASPDLRTYALDVMLESLGAALTALALYLYLRAKAAPAPGRWWRAFALVLTLLFLEKGNYWGLLVAGIVVAELLAAPRAIRAWSGAVAAPLRTRAFWAAQAHAPLTWIFVALAAVVIAITLRGPTAIILFGRPVSLYPPQNLMTAAYAVAFVRVVLAWRRARSSEGGAGPAMLSPAQRILVAWHALPLGVWFLLPRRLGAFLFFVSPQNAEAQMRFDPVAGFTHYVDWAMQLYHASPASFGLAAALAAVAVLNVRRLAPGGGAVIAVLAVSLVGASLHPNQKPRFLESWLPTLWMLAGAGGAFVLAALPAALGVWRRVVAVAVLLALASWHGPALLRPWQPPAGPSASSDLDIAALYLDRLPADRRVGVVSAIAGQSFFTWTYLTRFRNSRNLDIFRLFEGLDRDRLRADFEHWVRTSGAEVLVVVEGLDARYDLPEIGLVNAELAPLFAAALQAQGGFVRGEPRTDTGSAVRVTLWTRAR